MNPADTRTTSLAQFGLTPGGRLTVHHPAGAPRPVRDMDELLSILSASTAATFPSFAGLVAPESAGMVYALADALAYLAAKASPEAMAIAKVLSRQAVAK